MREETAPNRQLITRTLVERKIDDPRRFSVIYFETEEGYLKVIPQNEIHFRVQLISEPPITATYHNGYFSDWQELEGVEQALRSISYELVEVSRLPGQPPYFEVRKIIPEPTLILPCYCDEMFNYFQQCEEKKVNFPIIWDGKIWKVETAVEGLELPLPKCNFCGKRTLSAP